MEECEVGTSGKQKGRRVTGATENPSFRNAEVNDGSGKMA